MPMLELQGIHTYYGHVQALKGVDVTVEQGEIVTLIGANGAGKSTLLMTICGNPRATRGKVMFEGQDITRAPISAIVRQGVQQVPEGRRIFSRMTVLENLQMGATLGDPAHYKSDLERMFGMFSILEKRQGQRAGTLSGGEQQMLAICRALMSRPRLLMLDEPSLGLAPLIVKQIFKTIQDLNRENGTTILLVEQNAFHALKVAHRAYVLQNGEIRLQGSGQELLSNPEVRALYLEGGHHAT
jgi:branched-chain amino acid transport system ATP-binding protein